MACPALHEVQQYQIIRRETIKCIKSGVVLVNVSRGALIDTAALIEALMDIVRTTRINHRALYAGEPFVEGSVLT